jgi:hypothetical protein
MGSLMAFGAMVMSAQESIVLSIIFFKCSPSPAKAEGRLSTKHKPHSGCTHDRFFDSELLRPHEKAQWCKGSPSEASPETYRNYQLLKTFFTDKAGWFTKTWILFRVAAKGTENAIAIRKPINR